MGGVVAVVVVVGNHLKQKQRFTVDGDVQEVHCRVVIRPELALPIAASEDFGLVEGQHLRHLNGACRQGVESIVHQAHGQGCRVVSTGGGLAHVVHEQSVIGKRRGRAGRRIQERLMTHDARLPRLRQNLVGTNRVNRGVVGALEVREDAAAIVDDGVGRSGDPVSLAGARGTFEVSLGGVVVPFDEEHAQRVGSSGSVRLVEFVKHAAGVVGPTRSAPSRTKVQNHLVSRIEQCVEVVFLTAQIGRREIG